MKRNKYIYRKKLFTPNLLPEIKTHRLLFSLHTCCFILLSLSTSLLSLSTSLVRPVKQGKHFAFTLHFSFQLAALFFFRQIRHFPFLFPVSSTLFLQADSFVKSGGFHSIFGFKSTQPRHLRLNSISFFPPSLNS